jgi:hypothetical protein
LKTFSSRCPTTNRLTNKNRAPRRGARSISLQAVGGGSVRAATIRSIRALVKPAIRTAAAIIEAPVDPVATVIESAIRPIPAIVEPSVGTIAAIVEAAVDPVALVVEPI